MAKAVNNKKIKRQAVLLIHGIGEQRPMDSLRGFVRAVWTEAKELHRGGAGGGDMWSKPHRLSESRELKRITTPQNKAGIRTDFFELYWQHLMQGNQLKHVSSWAKLILLRNPHSIPEHLRSAYALIVVLLAVGAFFAYQAAFVDVPMFGDSKWFSVVATLLIIPVFRGVLNNIVGDAARYLNPSPENVGRREAIRKLGVEALRSLNDPENNYDRVIVVGHSLGSMIAYDILYHAWGEINDQQVNSADLKMDKLNQLEELVRQMADGNAELGDGEYQAKQAAYQQELRDNGTDWRVTDFITLGSPLAHAELLLAKDAADLQNKITSRELASCPPALEKSKHKVPKRLFSYPASAKNRMPHHAALFAATRWTNLYFPARHIIWGDLVGGPLGEIFGQGVQDRAVSTTSQYGLLSHTLYWSPNQQDYNAQHLVELRKALNLANQ